MTAEYKPAPHGSMHDIDDDGVCVKCGFDAAEWWHLEKQKPREDREPKPHCEGY